MTKKDTEDKFLNDIQEIEDNLKDARRLNHDARILSVAALAISVIALIIRILSVL